MSNEKRSDERPQHAMTDDTDDDALEQTVNDDAEAVQNTDEADEEPASPAEAQAERRIDGELRRKLNYALLLGLSLLALIAVIQFYLNMSAVINQWVAREFRSLFQAIFNLVVLLLVGAAISRQVQRLKE